MNDASEMRQSFRIVEWVSLQYEQVENQQSARQLLQKSIRNSPTSRLHSRILDLDARLEALLYRIKNDTPATADAIRLLSKKLDLVVESLPDVRQSRESLDGQPARHCELSAGGMVFGCDDIFSLQTGLLLRFVLTSDSYLYETYCTVVRCSAIQDNDTDFGAYSHQLAVKFAWHDMREREMLIQHLFSKQSETLRFKRLQSEIEE